MNARNALLALLEPSGDQRRAPEPDAPPEWLQAVADAVQRADVAQLEAAGFIGHVTDAIGDRRVRAGAGSGAPDGLWLLHLAPMRSHRALAWLPDSAGPWCTQVWIDARALRWPDDSAGPGALLPGHWADEHTWAAPFAPLNHPLQDWGRNAGMGTQRGLWVVSAATGTARVLMPPAGQHWAEPLLVPDETSARWLVQPQPGAPPVRP
jgi:hypothetical protein